jgi:class 3 adenylate cyclase/alpha-beta hydrolase superfamily lysophospholipase
MQRRLAAILIADVAGYSRLMGTDEAGTHVALQSHRGELIEPAVRKHAGRIVKLTGDGFLAEFGSVIAAIECAAEIQQEMTGRNRLVAADRRLMFRIGVHVGDVIVDQDDIYGDGVNIAARLESVAEPGGVCISRQAFDQVDGKLPLTFRAIGPQTLKNIGKPIDVFALEPGARDAQGAGNLQQQVHYCRAPDGVRLAWATVRHGPPLLKTANWLSHLELDWGSPVWRHVLVRLAGSYTLVRYDQRGMGLSDWEAADLSLEARVGDLEAVVDAAGIERFPVLGISQGCAVSIAYAVRHPQRVSHLILYGGFAAGYLRRAHNEAERERFTALKTLMRQGWGGENAAFRQIFTSQFIPGGSKEQIDWFNELQRLSTSAETAARMFQASAETDVTDLLARVRVPTLVMHTRGDAGIPFEFGQEMAAGIPGARFVALPSRNHLFLEGEPATERFFEELKLFLNG